MEGPPDYYRSKPECLFQLSRLLNSENERERVTLGLLKHRLACLMEIDSWASLRVGYHKRGKYMFFCVLFYLWCTSGVHHFLLIIPPVPSVFRVWLDFT